MRRKEIFLLLLIFIVAIAIRSVDLSSLPYSLHNDELFAGYFGRYLFLHGQDIYGNIFPLYFDKFGDFRPIGIFWLSGLATFIFGVNEFAIRFPSAFFGALTVFPIYLFGKELFNNKKIGILSAAFLAILPWHITLSRATSEAVIGLFFLYSFISIHLVFYKKTKN